MNLKTVVLVGSVRCDRQGIRAARYTERSLRARGHAAPPGLRFVLSAISPGVALANATGKTACGAPVGSPYIVFPAGAASGTLQFTNPNNTVVTYTLQLFSPTGSI